MANPNWRQEVTYLFAACVFPIHSWSLVQLLREVPAWILYLSSWDLLSVVAYTQAVALLESLGALLAILLLAILFPAHWFRERLVAQGSALILLTAGWAIPAHYGDEMLREWGMRGFALGGLVYLISLVLASWWIARSPRLQEIMHSVSERLTVLLYVYLPLSTLSVFVVLLRNLVLAR